VYAEIFKAKVLKDGWYRFGVRLCNPEGETLISSTGLRFEPSTRKMRDTRIKWGSQGGSNRDWVTIVEVHPAGVSHLRQALGRLIPRLEKIRVDNDSFTDSKINELTQQETEVFFGNKPAGIQEDSDDD